MSQVSTESSYAQGQLLRSPSHGHSAIDSCSEWSYGSGIHSERQSPPVLDMFVTFSDATPDSSPTRPPSVSTRPPFSASDDTWNLVPYDVSWGPEYEDYRSGTLPGPHGQSCIFLRSPTPLQKQRATEACQRCRERKAKCTGTRPSCMRCTSRGYACHYSSDAKVKPSTRTRRRSRRERSRPAKPSISRGIPIADVGHLAAALPSQDSSVSDPQEMEPSYSHDASPTSTLWEISTPSEELSFEEPWQFGPHIPSMDDDHSAIFPPTLLVDAYTLCANDVPQLRTEYQASSVLQPRDSFSSAFCAARPEPVNGIESSGTEQGFAPLCLRTQQHLRQDEIYAPYDGSLPPLPRIASASDHTLSAIPQEDACGGVRTRDVHPFARTYEFGYSDFLPSAPPEHAYPIYASCM